MASEVKPKAASMRKMLAEWLGRRFAESAPGPDVEAIVGSDFVSLRNRKGCCAGRGDLKRFVIRGVTT
jgi:hypothetical protein